MRQNITKKFKSDDSGVALVVTLVVLLVVMIFCLSLLVVSYQSYMTAQRKAEAGICEEASRSFSDELVAELSDTSSAFYTEMKGLGENWTSSSSKFNYSVSTDLDTPTMNVTVYWETKGDSVANGDFMHLLVKAEQGSSSSIVHLVLRVSGTATENWTWSVYKKY